MNHAQPKQYFAAALRAVTHGGGIDWEEMPSMAQRLINRAPGPRAPAAAEPAADSAWDTTMAAAFDDTPEPAQPFRESLGGGLATREVHEPDVFRHFFGNGAGAR